MSDIILKNCKLINNKITNLIIKEGKINKIKSSLLSSDKTTDKIIDIKENIIIPGLIDPHVHFRDPGLTHKENWKTGSMAAIHGGYTTVMDMPNTVPPTDTLKNFKEKKNIASKKSYCDYGLHAGVKSQKDVIEIQNENPTGYKIFMDLYETDHLKEMFGYIKNMNKPLLLHCEDHDLVQYNLKKLQENPENKDKTIMYSYARSPLTELIAVNRAIEFAELFNIQLYLCHITTRQTLELVKMAKSKININIEATPHHIFLTNDTYNTYGIKAKTNPPLRDKNYNITLKHLTEFDTIGTDHAPHTIEEKEKDTWTSMAGIPGLEVTMKLLLTEVNKNNLSLEKVVEMTSTKPAEIFKIPNKGKIAEGYDADITVLNMKQNGKINIDEFYTQGQYTPFENREYTGTNIMTINRGFIASENNEVYKQDAKYVY